MYVLRSHSCLIQLIINRSYSCNCFSAQRHIDPSPHARYLFSNTPGTTTAFPDNVRLENFHRSSSDSPQLQFRMISGMQTLYRCLFIL